jgi:hypothetical protein
MAIIVLATLVSVLAMLSALLSIRVGALERAVIELKHEASRMKNEEVTHDVD